ncbi:hypothetical protein QYF36_006698 [Acer negundo]|nr:hypothetical protein QYF36_006698 [Acer negundo]
MIKLSVSMANSWVVHFLGLRPVVVDLNLYSEKERFVLPFSKEGREFPFEDGCHVDSDYMVEKKGGHFNNRVNEEKKRSAELCILNNRNTAEVWERTKEDGLRGSFGSGLYGFGSKGRDKDLSKKQNEVQFHVPNVEIDETSNGPGLGVSNVHEVSSARGGVDNRVRLKASLEEGEIRSPTGSRVRKKKANVKALESTFEGAKGQACDNQLCHVGGSLRGFLEER